jgi:hypothetical protein
MIWFFNKTNSIYILQVVFRSTYWARTWSMLLKDEEYQEARKLGCRRWEMIAREILTKFASCSFSLSATSQQYFSLRRNQSSATSRQYFSLRTNQHQPSATSQPKRLLVGVMLAGLRLSSFIFKLLCSSGMLPEVVLFLCISLSCVFEI